MRWRHDAVIEGVGDLDPGAVGDDAIAESGVRADLDPVPEDGPLEDRADDMRCEIVGTDRRKCPGISTERGPDVAEDHRIARMTAHLPSIFAGRFSLNALTPSA